MPERQEPLTRASPWSSIGPLVVAVVAVVGTTLVCLQSIHAALNLMTLQARWATERGLAIQALSSYVMSHQPADRLSYQRAVGVLQDFDHLRRYFEGEPVPDDLVGRAMGHAGLNPRYASDMRWGFRLGVRWLAADHAARDWAEAQRYADELVRTGNAIHDQLGSHTTRDADLAWVSQLNHIDEAMARLEASLLRQLGDSADLLYLGVRNLLGTAAAALLLAGVVLTYRNVSRVLAHQHELEEANGRTRLTLRSAGVGLFELRVPDGLVQLDLNAARLHNLSVEAEALPLAALLSSAVEADRPRLQHQLQHLMVTESPEVFQWRYQVPGRDGQARTIDCVGQRHRRRGSVLGVCRDITAELQQSEEGHRRRAAESANRAHRQFLSRLSHELRTPLNAIIGFAQLLHMRLPAADTSADSSPRQHAGLILESGQHLLSLINEILDLSKVESGEVPVHAQAVLLQPVLESCARLIQPLAAQHEVRLVVADALPGAVVQADPQRLRQVLINLLSNACKYNRLGGAVHVSVEVRAAGVLIHVQDEGLGLSAQEQSQLFTPFTRIARTALKREGSGLGLYIARQMLTHMQGDLTVRSELGAGSCFSVCLPHASVQPQRPSALHVA